MRLKRSTCAAVIAVSAAVLGTALPAAAGTRAAGPSSAPATSAATSKHNASPTADPIKAILLESYGNCSSENLVWDRLNATWDSYGPVPVSIDFSSPLACASGFSLRRLEATDADVVILSSSGGGIKHFSKKEVADLKTYVNEGHTLIGTKSTLALPPYIDNTRLAPLFGLRQDVGWGPGGFLDDATYQPKNQKPETMELFRNLTDGFHSLGSPYAIVPEDGKWTFAPDGAKVIGTNFDWSAAITLYDAKNYHAIYIASMPEYQGGPEDMQFLYNAITFDRLS